MLSTLTGSYAVTAQKDVAPSMSVPMAYLIGDVAQAIESVRRMGGGAHGRRNPSLECDGLRFAPPILRWPSYAGLTVRAS